MLRFILDARRSGKRRNGKQSPSGSEKNNIICGIHTIKAQQ